MKSWNVINHHQGVLLATRPVPRGRLSPKMYSLSPLCSFLYLSTFGNKIFLQICTLNYNTGLRVTNWVMDILVILVNLRNKIFFANMYTQLQHRFVCNKLSYGHLVYLNSLYIWQSLIYSEKVNFDIQIFYGAVIVCTCSVTLIAGGI